MRGENRSSQGKISQSREEDQDTRNAGRRISQSFPFLHLIVYFFLYIFIAECSLPPKIKTTIVILQVLVQCATKELGGITSVMNLTSTDCTLVDHTHPLLMVSAGTLSEVHIIP